MTPQLQECRDFYRNWLDFDVVFEASWFALLNSGSTTIAFMHLDHPSSPPNPGTYNGDGAFLTLQVEDAGAEYDGLSAEDCSAPCRLPTSPGANVASL